MDDSAWATGYYLGVAFGASDSMTNAFAIQSFIPGVFGAFLGFFWQLATVEVLGVSAVSVLAALFTLSTAFMYPKIKWFKSL